jgi:hypothetical protein
VKFSRSWQDALLFIPETKAQAKKLPGHDHQGWDHTCIEKEAASIKGRSGAAQERARGDSDLKLQVAVEIRRRLG